MPDWLIILFVVIAVIAVIAILLLCGAGALVAAFFEIVIEVISSIFD